MAADARLFLSQPIATRGYGIDGRTKRTTHLAPCARVFICVFRCMACASARLGLVDIAVKFTPFA